MRLTAIFILAIAVGRASAQPASSQELHTLVNDGNYAQALAKIASALQLKGPAAKTVNRYDLFMLKGECHLQTKAITLALESYANALKEASDEHERAIATAHEMLIKQSKAFAYTPKKSHDNPRPTPIDILNTQTRKKAFAALLTDELAANEPKIKTAKAAKSLPPIAALFKPLAAMEGLEVCATEKSDKIDALRKELAEQSKKAVADTLRAMSKRLGEIDKQANTFVEFYQEVNDPFSPYPRTIKKKAYKKKGVSDEQTHELQETVAVCDKLSPALDEFTQGLKTEPKALEPFVEEAARIRKEVDRVLDIDYQRVYERIPK